MVDLIETVRASACAGYRQSMATVSNKDDIQRLWLAAVEDCGNLPLEEAQRITVTACGGKPLISVNLEMHYETMLENVADELTTVEMQHDNKPRLSRVYLVHTNDGSAITNVTALLPAEEVALLHTLGKVVANHTVSYAVVCPT